MFFSLVATFFYVTADPQHLKSIDQRSVAAKTRRQVRERGVYETLPSADRRIWTWEKLAKALPRVLNETPPQAVEVTKLI